MVITISIKMPVFVDSFFFTTISTSGATLHHSHSTPDILIQETSASTNNISLSKPTAKKSSSSDCYMTEIGSSQEGSTAISDKWFHLLQAVKVLTS